MDTNGHNGNGKELPAFVTCDLEPGDLLTIETPGGGGFGALDAVRRTL